MTKKFIIEIEEGENTRWELSYKEFSEVMREATEAGAAAVTTGTIPRVTVKELKPHDIELLDTLNVLFDRSAKERIATPGQVRRIHAAARLAHPKAKPCQCEICRE